jgi:hypothetical protein
LASFISLGLIGPGILLDRDSLYLVERDFVIVSVIKLGRPRRFMVRDLLRDFEFSAVLQIRRDAGRAEGMIADPCFDAGRFGAPADDAVGVLLEERIGCKLAGLATGGTEEIAVDVIGDAGRFDIALQTLIETMITGNVGLLAALDADVSTFPIGSISRLILGKRPRFYRPCVKTRSM